MSGPLASGPLQLTFSRGSDSLLVALAISANESHKVALRHSDSAAVVALICNPRTDSLVTVVLPVGPALTGAIVDSAIGLGLTTPIKANMGPGQGILCGQLA